MEREHAQSAADDSTVEEPSSSFGQLFQDVTELAGLSTEYLDLRVQRLGLGVREEIVRGILLLALFLAGALFVAGGIVMLEFLVWQAISSVWGTLAAWSIIAFANLALGVGLTLFAWLRETRA